MAKDRYAPKQLNDVVAKLSPRLGAGIARHQNKHSEHQAYHAVLAEAVGPNLEKKCKISDIEQGTLVIETASASIAMKLNYIKMDILSAFRQAGMADLCQVKISHNVKSSLQSTAAATAKKSPTVEKAKQQTMSESTAESLEQLAADAPPSLQAVLLRLAKHGRQKK